MGVAKTIVNGRCMKFIYFSVSDDFMSMYNIDHQVTYQILLESERAQRCLITSLKELLIRIQFSYNLVGLMSSMLFLGREVGKAIYCLHW